jgi:hypothetical protein
VNKFEALKMFQEWPPEWQRLCAEYWIETGEVDPTQVWTTADRLESTKRLTVSLSSDQAPYGQRKAAKLAIERPRMRQSKLAWSTAESEFILKLANEVDMPHAVEMFVAQYPARSRDAVRRRVWGIRNGELSSEVKY